MIEEEDNGFQECLDTARGMDTIACTAPASTIPRPASTAPFRDSEPLAWLIKTRRLHRLIFQEKRLSNKWAEVSVRGTLRE